MNCDVFDLDSFFRPRLLVYVQLLQIIEYFQSLYDLAEYRVFAIKMWRRRKGDEELTAVRIRTLVCHANDASGIVSKGRSDLILEKLVWCIVVDGRGTLRLRVGSRTASLRNEVRDQTVKGTAIVEAGSAEGEEVLSCLRDRLAEYLELDVSFGGVELTRLLAHDPNGKAHLRQGMFSVCM